MSSHSRPEKPESSRPTRLSITFLAVGMALLLACEGDPGPTGPPGPPGETFVPSKVEIAGGNGQTGEISKKCDDPLSVRVLTADDRPVENVRVLFRIESGDATLEEEISFTDANGIAIAYVYFGEIPDVIKTSASISGLQGSPAMFTLTSISPYPGVSATEVGKVDIAVSLLNVGDIFGSYLHEITESGNTLYIPLGALTTGLYVIDVTDKTKPSIVTHLITTATRDLAVDGNTMCSVNGKDLDVFDISSAHSPELVGTLSLGPGSGSAATCVAVVDTIAYVTGGGPYLGTHPALRTINISDPAVPVELDISDESGAADVWTDGNTAFVSSYENGLRIYDVSTPSNIQLLSSAGTVGDAARVQVVGSLAYVLNFADYQNSSLTVLDVTDLSSPSIVGTTVIPQDLMYGSYYLDGIFVGFAVDGDKVYIGGWKGIVVVDVGDPSDLVPLGLIGPRNFTGGISVKDGYVFGANLDGLVVLNDVQQNEGAP